MNSIEGMIEEYERRLGGMTIGFLEGLFPKRRIQQTIFSSIIKLEIPFLGAGRLLQRARDTETMYFQVKIFTSP